MQYMMIAAVEADTHRLAQWLEEHGTAFALNLLFAAAILVIGRWVAKMATRALGAAIGRGQAEETLARFVTTLAYTLMMVLVIVVALDRLGVPTTSLAAVLAAGGLAIGLALQGSLSNFAAGILLIVLKPFRVGHYVEAGGTAGIVEEIQIFHTVLRTPDNRRVIVPNSAINNGTVTNYSALDTRRIDLVIGCGYNDDLRAVKQFLEEVVAGDERIMKDPAPFVAIDALADSSINFAVRPWVKASDYAAVKSDLLEKIKLGFDERGFNIPYPQQDVHLHQAKSD
jgi:small conductance mechanosensitive channel